MREDIAATCARLFRIAADLDNSVTHARLTDADLLTLPFESFEIDSLSTLEFVMAVEDALAISLDEDAVNRCVDLADFVALVSDQHV